VPASTVEGKATHDALPAEPDMLQRSLLDQVLNSLGSRRQAGRLDVAPGHDPGHRLVR
jgi:hypothetical protein